MLPRVGLSIRSNGQAHWFTPLSPVSTQRVCVCARFPEAGLLVSHPIWSGGSHFYLKYLLGWLKFVSSKTYYQLYFFLNAVSFKIQTSLPFKLSMWLRFYSKLERIVISVKNTDKIVTTPTAVLGLLSLIYKEFLCINKKSPPRVKATGGQSWTEYSHGRKHVWQRWKV